VHFAMMIRLPIRYVVLLGDYQLNQVSPFQGNSFELLKRVHDIFDIPRRLPSTAAEPFFEQVPLIQGRIAGISPYTIIPLTVRSLAALEFPPESPFWVLVSDEDTLPDACRAIERAPYPILHASIDGAGGVPLLTSLDGGSIRAHVESVVEIVGRDYPEVDLVFLPKVIARRPDRQTVKLPFSRKDHYCTIPSEVALESVGFGFSGKETIRPGTDDPYIEAMLRVAWPLTNMRENGPKDERLERDSPPTPSLILTSTSTYKHVRQRRLPPPSDRDPEFASAIRLAVKMIQKQKDFSHHLDISSAEPLRDRVFQGVLDTRVREIATFTLALSARSASTHAPLLRLPPRVNGAMGLKKQLGDCIRASGPRHQAKANRLVGAVMDELAASVDDRFLMAIDRFHSGITIVSDAPIEWLPIRGLPLMLRNSVCRTTATPGDLCFQQVMPNEQVHLDIESFDDVLVLRSFKKIDPLYSVLEAAIKYGIPGHAECFRFVDVTSQKELVEACNSYSGPAVIFDGHGAHDTGLDAGYLDLAGSPLDPWSLRGVLRVPPIVILSACDTHALDGSHASTANGFLACGARTVIGSLLPIDGRNGATFLVRLMLRLQELVRPVVQRGRVFRWIDVVAALQQMMFAHDLIRLVARSAPARPNSAEVDRCAVRATALIHTEYDWYEKVVEDVASLCGVGVDAVEALRQEKFLLPEAIKYVQMGDAASILIRSGEAVHAKGTGFARDSL
jgi:hypothetical protein